MRRDKKKASGFSYIIKNPAFLKFLRPYKNQIFILSLWSLFSSAFLIVGPYFSKLFIDKAFINKDLAKFLNLSVWGAGIFIFSTIIGITEDILKNRATIKVKLSLANKFIRKIYSLDMNFFQSMSAGENVYRIGDTESVANFILNETPQILVDLIKLFIMLGIAFYLSAKMTVFLLILSPLFLLHNIYIQNKLRPIYGEMWRYGARLAKETYEAFSRILIIKALGLEAYQRHSYLRSVIKNIRWKIRSFRWGIISTVASSFLSKAIYGAVTLYGGWLIIKGNLSIGSYTAVMIYLTQGGGLIESLGYKLKYLNQELISMGRFFEVMNIQPQIKNLPGARVLGMAKGEVSFCNVRFGYKQERPILKGVDFTIPAFSWAGIAGLSGCGKTTVANLILRLYDPWEGNVSLDGVDLKTINLKSLREKIAIATQQPLLFDVSIRENITYGLKGISQGQLDEVAKITCLDSFIRQLPNSYDTLIGEDACRLSQGFKQRLSLARVVLRRPQLLILDEATSSVDSFTEEKIYKNLRLQRQGLTTIIISHRLFSIKDADRIYFFKEDGMIEQGTHTELFSTNALYREFFQNQIEAETII